MKSIIGKIVKLMNGAFHCSYLRLLYKFYPRMKTKRIQLRIEKTLKELNNTFTKDDTDQTFNGLFEIISCTNNRLEFKIGDYQFVIIGTATLTHRFGFLKTYEIVLNLKQYPETEAIHLPELDIYLDANDSMAFSLKMDTSNIRNDAYYPNDELAISNLELQYPYRLHSLIAKRENEEVQQMMSGK